MRVLGAFCVHVCVCVRVAGAQNEFRVASQVSILIHCTTLRVPITSAKREREREAPSSATPRTNRLRDDDAHAALSDWQPTLFSGVHKFEFSRPAPRAPKSRDSVRENGQARVALGLKSKFCSRVLSSPGNRPRRWLNLWSAGSDFPWMERNLASFAPTETNGETWINQRGRYFDIYSRCLLT